MELLAAGGPFGKGGGPPGPPGRFSHGNDKAARVEPAYIPPHVGFHEHNNRQNRGDHIRYRNRLPDEYEDSQWFEDLDLEDGVDFVEGVLGFFFFIGSITLVLLPFFLLASALKRMVRLARRSHSSAGSGSGSPPAPAAAPEGYQALLEDVSDDDAAVVTGTPVNPPPSVHI